MIAVDTNILVYAHRSDSPHHPSARRTVKNLAEGDKEWAIPWHCIAEFYNIVTHPKIYDPPSTPKQAVKQIDVWLESPSLSLLHESAQSWPELRKQLLSSAVRGPRVFDARIAALCLEHGVSRLYTADRDFAAFQSLLIHNPLSA